jgi:hypothetical protein
LAPGRALHGLTPLLGTIPELAPGRYQISALLADESGQQGESAPVTVTVAPSTPRNLSLIDTAGRTSAILYGAWVNMAAEPLEVIRCRFALLPGGQAGNAVRIGTAGVTASTHPVLSVGCNGEAASSQYVAWVAEDRALWFSHADDCLGATPPASVALGAPRGEVIVPLYSDPQLEPAERPAGAALVLLTDGGRSRLAAFGLRPGAAALAAACDLPGPPPVWAMSHIRSDGTRVVTYAQHDGAETTLCTVPWPTAREQAAQPRSLAKWRGRLAAGGASLDARDAIHGASLLLATDPAQRATDVVPWVLDARGEFAAQPSRSLQWDATEALAGATVRVDAAGNPVVLMRGGDGAWVLHSAGQRRALPGVFARSPFPVAVGFFGGETRPVLICGTEGTGFHLLEIDGSPLPPRFRG